MFINCQRRGFSATGKLVTSLLWVVVSITGFLLIGVVAHFLGDLTSGEFVAFDVPIASFSIFSLVFSLSTALLGLMMADAACALVGLLQWRQASASPMGWWMADNARNSSRCSFWQAAPC